MSGAARRSSLRLRLPAAVLCISLAAAAPSAAQDKPTARRERPRIGLALGGGGALGFAHVGVLKVLEENHIPIDYIAGTSIGAIVAGLYASGMAPDEIEGFLKSLNWWEVLSDATPRRELYFRRKQEDQRYLFNMELGLKNSGLATASGTAAGQKFNNLMQHITLRVAGISEFDDLPIPYRTVATDLRTGERVVLSSGNLSTAMRASMALPGVFTPVTIDDRILVDGGVVDNIPVDAVRDMGADIIIAVDVGAPAQDTVESKLTSLGGILGRTYEIMRRPHQDAALTRADIVLQPDLEGFSKSQFHRVADIIPVGEAAARAISDQLLPYRVDDSQFERFLNSQRRAMPEALPIAAIEVGGMDRVDERRIRNRIRSSVGEPYDADTVTLDLMRIYGIGDFEQVLFQVRGRDDGGYALEYQVKEKPWGPTYVHFGLRLQSDFEGDADWRVLLNITAMNLNTLGGEWRTDLEFGSSWRVFSEWYQPLDFAAAFFVAPNIEYTSDLEDLYDGNNRVAEYEVAQLQGRLDLGVQLRHYAELRAGPLWIGGKAKVDTGASELPEIDEEVAGGVLTLTMDRQDRTLFARDGYYFTAEAVTARELGGSDREFDKLSAQYRQFISRGDHTVMMGLQGGTSLGSDLPGYAEFLLGGPHRFAGLAEDQLRGQYVGSGSLGYRYRISRLPPTLGRGVYAVVRGDLGNVWQESSDVDLNDTLMGVGIGLGADTALGPAYIGYGRAEGGFDRFYFSLGTAF